MINRYFPPVRETMLVVVITVVFLLLTASLYRAPSGQSIS